MNGIEKYVTPDNYDREYWEESIDEHISYFESTVDRENADLAVVTISTWRGSSDCDHKTLYMTLDEYYTYTTWNYMYWNGIRIREDLTIEKMWDCATGGPEVIYVGPTGDGCISTTDYCAPPVKLLHMRHTAEEKRKAEEAKRLKAEEKKAKTMARKLAQLEKLKKELGK